MNDTLRKGAWEKGWTDIIDHWVSNNLTSYTTKGKLCECIAFEKLEFPLRDLISNSHHRNLMRYHWATTPLLSFLIALVRLAPTFFMFPHLNFVFQVQKYSSFQTGEEKGESTGNMDLKLWI